MTKTVLALIVGNMTSAFRLLLLAVMVSLAACGGGGGGDICVQNGGTIQQFVNCFKKTPSPSPNPVITSWPLSGARIFATQGPQTFRTFTVSGQIANDPVTGTGTAAESGHLSSTFESVYANQQDNTVSMTLTRNGATTTSSSTVSVFFDASFVLVGTSSASEYAVVAGAVTIPLTVMVNDSGTAYTTNRYLSPAKTTFIGTETVTYVVLPDTATTALLQITHTQRDTLDVTTSQVISTALLTGVAQPKELERTLLDLVNNSSLTLTY